MKKIFSMVILATIVACTAVFTSCQNKEKVIPEGTQIFDFKYVEEIDAEGQPFISIVEEDGTLSPTEYTTIELTDDSIVVAKKADGLLNLLDNKGSYFAICDSFVVETLYQAGIKPSTERFIKTYLSNGDHLCYGFDTKKILVEVDGIKKDGVPLSNGVLLYEKETGWGIEGTESIRGAECSAITVFVTAKDETFYWIKTKDFTGVLDGKGNVVSRMTASQMNVKSKSGKTLWIAGNGKIKGVLVKKI